MKFKSKRGEAIGMLHALKARYTLNRSAGWDRKLQGAVMRVIVKYAGGNPDDTDLLPLHLEFLDALIGMLEAEEAIDKAVNRQPAKPKVEELA